MSKSRKGGLPRDTLFRQTEVIEERTREEAAAETDSVAEALEPAAEDTATEAVAEDMVIQDEKKTKPRAKRVSKSQSKHVDNKTSHADDDTAGAEDGENQKTTDAPRQTYYVPAEMHKQLRMLALEQERNVSDLVVEGIEWVLGKYGG